MADPLREEIWLADLGSGLGHEQSGQRPVLVVSDDSFNAGLAELVMIVPLTSKVAKSKIIPAHIRIDPPQGGLKTPSAILCDQLRSISKNRLGKTPWGTVSGATLTKVEKVLRCSCDCETATASDRRARSGQNLEDERITPETDPGSR